MVFLNILLPHLGEMTSHLCCCFGFFAELRRCGCEMELRISLVQSLYILKKLSMSQLKCSTRRRCFWVTWRRPVPWLAFWVIIKDFNLMDILFSYTIWSDWSQHVGLILSMSFSLREGGNIIQWVSNIHSCLWDLWWEVTIRKLSYKERIACMIWKWILFAAREQKTPLLLHINVITPVIIYNFLNYILPGKLKGGGGGGWNSIRCRRWWLCTLFWSYDALINMVTNSDHGVLWFCGFSSSWKKIQKLH